MSIRRRLSSQQQQIQQVQTEPSKKSFAGPIGTKMCTLHICRPLKLNSEIFDFSNILLNACCIRCHVLSVLFGNSIFVTLIMFPNEYLISRGMWSYLNFQCEMRLFLTIGTFLLCLPPTRYFKWCNWCQKKSKYCAGMHFALEYSRKITKSLLYLHSTRVR